MSDEAAVYCVEEPGERDMVIVNACSTPVATASSSGQAFRVALSTVTTTLFFFCGFVTVLRPVIPA